MPASQALWQQTLEKFARAPFQLSQYRITATNDFAQTFQELIADCVRGESFVEITGDTNRIAECVMAVRLPAIRAEFWRTNLLAILETWTASRGERLPAGWQLRKQHHPDVLRFITSGDWVLIGCGENQLPLHDEYSRQIRQSGRPVAAGTEAWLEVFLDGPNLPAAKANHGLPTTDLSLMGRGSNLRLSGEFTFRNPFSWKPEPWQIPTNLVREPIIGFTAIQGLAPVLRRHQDLLGLRPDSIPNQFFIWAGANSPVQTLAAAPLSTATESLRELGPQLLDRFNPELQARNAGGLQMATNLSGVPLVRWVDIPPFVTPFLSAERDSAGDYLFAGIFPNWSGTNPPPVLFHYLTERTNLVFYDWEATGEHAWAWRVCINIFRHFFEKPRLGTDSASITWINSVSNRLGNTVTEITRSDSNRLSLVRQGPVGMTGLELITLAHWLESASFPLSGFSLPARTNQMTSDK